MLLVFPLDLALLLMVSPLPKGQISNNDVRVIKTRKTLDEEKGKSYILIVELVVKQLPRNSMNTSFVAFTFGNNDMKNMK